MGGREEGRERREGGGRRKRETDRHREKKIMPILVPILRTYILWEPQPLKTNYKK